MNGKTSHRAVGPHLSAELRTAVQPLEDGAVGVVDLVVRVHSRVVPAGEHLIVPGVGEPVRVRHGAARAAVSVADQHSLAGDDVVQERRQKARAIRHVDELTHGLLGLVRVLLVLRESRLGAAKDLLPANPVERDDDDPPPAVRGRGGRHGHEHGEHDAAELPKREARGVHGWIFLRYGSEKPTAAVAGGRKSGFRSAPERARTSNPQIRSLVLYPLSYGRSRTGRIIATRPLPVNEAVRLADAHGPSLI